MNVPVMHCFSGFAIAFVIGIAYLWLLFRYGKKNKPLLRALCIAACLIFLVNGIADFIVINTIANKDINVFSPMQTT